MRSALNRSFSGIGDDRWIDAVQLAVGTINPLTAMRKISSLALLLLGGCASAGAPAPAALESAPVSVNIRPLKAADSPRVTQKIVGIQSGACQTNDPMPTGSFRVAPQGHPGLMPGMRTHVPSMPMPNLCPVKVPPTGQMFYHAVPARAKQVPQPEPAPQAQP